MDGTLSGCGIADKCLRLASALRSTTTRVAGKSTTDSTQLDRRGFYDKLSDIPYAERTLLSFENKPSPVSVRGVSLRHPV
jgi:hypothetical protein